MPGPGYSLASAMARSRPLNDSEQSCNPWRTSAPSGALKVEPIQSEFVMSHVSPDVKLIFLEAIEKGLPEELARYLDVACQGNAIARARVEQLLQAHHNVDQFLGGASTNNVPRDSSHTETL